MKLTRRSRLGVLLMALGALYLAGGLGWPRPLDVCRARATREEYVRRSC